MPNQEYEVELKIDEEKEHIVDDLNEKLGVDFTERGGEEAGLGTALGFYSAVVGTAGLALTIYSIVKEEDPSVEVIVKHEGEGDVYFIDVDEAERVGGTIIEQKDGMAIAELSTKQAVEAYAEPDDE